MAVVIMSVFELALVMKVATCCLLYRGHVVPKDVCVALGTHRVCQRRRARMRRAVCMTGNLFVVVGFGRRAVDITATSVKFESPLADVLEASHRSSGCLAILNVGSSVELLGAWVDCARKPNCGIIPVSLSDFTP